MDAIDALLQQRPAAPSGIVSGEAMIYNGTTWVRSSVTGLTPSGIAGYPADATKFLRGDGNWAVVSVSAKTGSVVSDLGAASDGALGLLHLMPTTGIATAGSLPTGTITVYDTTGFPTSGTFVLDGQSVTYTGLTRTTFTGCSGGTGSFAVNDTVRLTSGTPTNPMTTVELVYSSTIGNWVSRPQVIEQLTTPGNGAISASWADTGTFQDNFLPWRIHDAAGLKPQLLLGGAFRSAGTPSVGLGYRSNNGGNSGAAASVDITASQFQITPAGNTPHRTPFNPQWAQINSGYTVADYLAPQLRSKGDGTNAVVVDGVIIQIRWVG
jgi:hypothetical protein